MLGGGGGETMTIQCQNYFILRTLTTLLPKARLKTLSRSKSKGGWIVNKPKTHHVFPNPEKELSN